MFEPRFQLAPETANALMMIEALRSELDHLPVSPQMIASLRKSARLLSTHHSTQIEGNRLTLPEVEQVLGGKGGFPGRERDEREVRNYFLALEQVEVIANAARSLAGEDVRLLHGLAFEGVSKGTPYRDGQNVIRDGIDGRIVYLPPEATDVPTLMECLVEWINRRIDDRLLPAPVVAALAHYQFATIHPYYDGNGRTARLLASLVLHRCGYGLSGLYSLEEYYARNLPAYYDALTVGGSHNYYMGRAEADVSQFVTYFCVGMADAFAKVRERAATAISQGGARNHNMLLRDLRPPQRQALGLFAENRIVTVSQLAEYLGVSPRQARDWTAKWVDQGFLEVENASKKSRSYRLADRYEAGLI
jgi:Fic family protein